MKTFTLHTDIEHTDKRKGLSLASTIADIFLTKMFDESTPKLKFKPKFIKKFIDDVISTAPADQVPEATTIFNNFDEDKRLEFTYEIEENNRLNFLDMTLIHMSDQKIKTDWYSKATSSHRILNFLSAHPPKLKENVAIEFTNRVLSLSDPIFKPKNIELIKSILTENNYPKKTINKAIAIYNNKINQRQRQQPDITSQDDEQEPTKIYRSMQYVPRLTQAVNKQLRAAIPELIVAPKPTKQLQYLFTKTKTKIPKEKRTNTIYRIQCKSENCPHRFYIGETKRTVEKRGLEHRSNYNNRHTPGYKSALVNHSIDFPGHEPNTEPTDIKILDQEENSFKRRIIESCYINLYGTHSNNFKRDANRLHNNYSNILDTYKRINTDT